MVMNELLVIDKLIPKGSFIGTEISVSYLEYFLYCEKLKSACLKYSDSNVDIEMINLLVSEFFLDMFDLKESIYAYFWLRSKKQCKRNMELQNHYKGEISEWFKCILNHKSYDDYTAKGITTYDVYTACEYFPFNIEFNSIYCKSDMYLMLDEFGEGFIPTRVIDILNKYGCEINSGLELSSLLYEDFCDSGSISNKIFYTNTPNSISDDSFSILFDCYAMAYSDINIGCISFVSSCLSNFLKTADSSSINELLDIIGVLIPHVSISMECASKPRVISKDSPLWDICKKSRYIDESIEYIIVSSYFCYNIDEVFSEACFCSNELENLDSINNKLRNLLKL